MQVTNEDQGAVRFIGRGSFKTWEAMVFQYFENQPENPEKQACPWKS